MVKRVLITIFLAGLPIFPGCAKYTHYPAGTVRQINAAEVTAVVERESVSVPVQELEEAPPEDYIIGPTDILTISLQGKDITAVQVPMEKVQGFQVDGSGYISVPMAGRIKVSDLTVSQTQELLQERLKGYIKEPFVIVDVSQRKSQALYLIGQFKAPGVHFMDRPVNLIQGMALGSGPDSSANLHSARLLRNKKIVPVDIYDLLHNGDLSQNIRLKGGDTVYIPDIKARSVFVFGAVKSPGQVPMPNGPMSLPQALALAGFSDMTYDRHIRIVRSISTTRGELIVVDIDKIMNGVAAPFTLAEGDIVYVPSSRVANWNEALNEILPTLQTISALLNPFVQIKYLSNW